jgi:hypothetical protein
VSCPCENKECEQAERELRRALFSIRLKAFDYLNSVDVQKGRISVAGVGFLYGVMGDATAALKDGGLK